MSMSKRLVVVVLGVSSLLGACGSVQQDFVNRIDARTRLILPQYKKYVQNDPKLDPAARSERLRQADNLQRVINAAREQD